MRKEKELSKFNVKSKDKEVEKLRNSLSSL
jgi:hypothetical protein